MKGNMISRRQKVFTAILTVVPVYLIIFTTPYFDGESTISKIAFGVMLCLPIGYRRFSVRFYNDYRRHNKAEKS